MRTATISLLILSMFIWIFPAHGQNSARRDYIQNSFEVSLMSLQQRAQETIERNNWLWSQIQNFKKQIPLLQEQVTAYENYESIQQESAQLNTSHLDVQKPFEFNVSYQSKDELMGEVLSLNNEIEQLAHKITLVDRGAGAFDSSMPQDKQQVLMQIHDVRSKINQSENYLTQLQKRHGRRSSVYRSLLRKQNLLRQKFTLLENEMNLAKREQLALEDELDKLASRQEVTFTKLNENVVELRSNSEVLEKTLNRAYNKIKNKNINFNITDEELHSLMENVQIIDRERQRLHSEYVRLSKDYEQMQISVAPDM